MKVNRALQNVRWYGTTAEVRRFDISMNESSHVYITNCFHHLCTFITKERDNVYKQVLDAKHKYPERYRVAYEVAACAFTADDNRNICVECKRCLPASSILTKPGGKSGHQTAPYEVVTHLDPLKTSQERAVSDPLPFDFCDWRGA